MSSPTSLSSSSSSSLSSSPLLLCILVKSAKIQITDDECYSYAVLKIDNVKSTTSIVKGQQPIWEEEFYFDVPNCSMGIQIELWERSQIMDKLLGLCYIFYDDKENENKFHERRIILDSELVLNKQGKICRTCKPTEHSLLICTYIQLPSNLTEEESKELTKKFEILHEILDKKGKQLQDVTLDEINSFSTMYFQQQSCLHNQQLTNHSHSNFANNCDYSFDKSYPISSNHFLLSMSQSNIIKSRNENNSSSISTKKPLAFVQPVVRDLHSCPTSNQISLTYITQPRKLPMNKRTDFNDNKKK